MTLACIIRSRELLTEFGTCLLAYHSICVCPDSASQVIGPRGPSPSVIAALLLACLPSPN